MSGFPLARLHHRLEREADRVDLLCYSTPDLQDVYATYQVAIIVEAYLALATVISA